MSDASHCSNATFSRRPLGFALLANEALLLILLIATALLCVAISTIYSKPVDWSGFGTGAASAAALFAAGLYARIRKNRENLAHLAIANSIYLGFTCFTTLLIFLRFPTHDLSVDLTLTRIDSLLGYNWPAFVEFFAGYPLLSRILGLVYASSLAQLIILVAYLALTGRILLLHRTLLAGSISLLLTTMIWWVAPSVGPSALFELSDRTVQATGLVTNNDYGAYLRLLVDQGLQVVSPENIVGAIAFPSYHTVMALLVVWYLRGTCLFFPALTLNTLMIPAILMHGGHHLTDVIGGIVTFSIAAVLAGRIAPNTSSPQPEIRSLR